MDVFTEDIPQIATLDCCCNTILFENIAGNVMVAEADIEISSRLNNRKYENLAVINFLLQAQLRCHLKWDFLFLHRNAIVYLVYLLL